MFDGHNRMLMTGKFQGTVDFNPGAGVNNISMPMFTTYCLFAAKYDTDLNYINAIGLGTSGTSVGYRILNNSLNEYVVLGTCTNTIDFDPGPGVVNASMSSSNFFMLKLDSAFNYMDSKIVPGPLIVQHARFDSSDRLVVMGSVSGSADVDPGPATVTVSSVSGSTACCAYITYSPALAYQNAFVIGNSSAAGGTRFDLDAQDRICAIIQFKNTLDVNPLAGITNVTSVASSTDVLVGKYQQDGTLINYFTLGNSSNDSGRDILAVGKGVVICGDHTGLLDFDPGPGINSNQTPSSHPDGFIARYETDCVPNAVTLSATICNGEAHIMGGEGFTESGTYVRFFETATGCDSIVTLNLTVENIPAEVDVLPGSNMMIVHTPGTIQWYNHTGGIIIPGATNDTLTVSDYNAYSAIVTYSGCTDTTAYYSVNPVINSQVPTLDWAYATSFSWLNGLPNENNIMMTPGHHVLLGSSFEGTIDMDVKTGVTTISSDRYTTEEMFFAKYTPGADFIWTRHAGSYYSSDNYSRNRSMAVDKNGNIYVLGDFYHDFDIDYGPGVNMMVGNYGLFIAKYTPSGQLIAAKAFANNSSGEPHSLAIDKNGNLLLCGSFSNTADFDPGPAVNNLTIGYLSTTFIVKMDGNLNYLWGYSYPMPFINENEALSCTFDSRGNVLVGGFFHGTVDFNPGAGVFNMTASGGVPDSYIVKFSPSGVFKWARKRGVGGGKTTSLKVDAMDNVFASGGSSLHVRKYDSLGTFKLDFPILGASDEVHLFIDDYQRVYVYFPFLSAGDISGHTISSTGGIDNVLACFDNNGTYRWHFSLGEASCDQIGKGFTVDHNGDIYIVGRADCGTTDFDPSTGTYNVTQGPSTGYGYIAKYGASCSPVLSFPPLSPACIGSAPFALSGATPAGGTYTGTGVSGGVFDPTTTGTYPITYTYTDAGGCISSYSNILTVDAPPAAAATNTGPVCEGDLFSLNTTNVTGATYAWSGPGGYTSNIPNPDITGTTAAMSGVYAVTVTNGGCSSMSATTVTVHPLPTAAATNTGGYCAGQNIQLNTPAVAGGTYSWAGPGGYTSTTQNPTLPGSTVAMAGTYSVTVMDGTCSAASSTTVIIDSIPAAIAAANNGPVCEGTSLDLSIPTIAGATYAWAGPGGYNSSSQNPVIGTATLSASGPYTVTVTLGSCSATLTTAATVTPLPAASAGNNGPVCEGSPLDLSTTTVTGASYNWDGPGGFTSSMEDPSVAAATIGGTYTVTVTAAGCTSTSSTTVVVNPQPNVVATNDGPVCAGGDLNLGSTTIAGATYSWTGPGSFTSPLQNILVSPVVLAAAGTYSIIVTDANGCSDTASTTVNINPLPEVTVSPNVMICPGTTTVLTASSGSTPLSYDWSPVTDLSSPTTASTNASPASNTTYVVTVSDGNCSNSDSVSVDLFPAAPAPAITHVFDTLIASPGLGPYTYQWYLDGTPISGANGSTCIATTNGNYTVELTDDNGCSAVSASYLFTSTGTALDTRASGFSIYPNPNNGMFTVTFSNTISENCRLLIYDGVGKIVYDNTVKTSGSNNAVVIQTNHLARGTYTVAVNDGNSQYRQKLVVNY